MGQSAPSPLRVKGLKALYALPAGSHVDECDLSRQGLTKMPNLSMYRITRLDLSHNRIRRVDNMLLFPQDVVSLDLSHNGMELVEDTKDPKRKKRDLFPERTEFVNFYPMLFPKLEVLDISYNRIKELRLPPTVRHVNVEHNDMWDIRYCFNLFGDEDHRITYLNLNDNPRLWRLNFKVASIDTLLSRNCAGGKDLNRLDGRTCF